MNEDGRRRAAAIGVIGSTVLALAMFYADMWILAMVVGALLLLGVIVYYRVLPSSRTPPPPSGDGTPTGGSQTPGS